MSEALAAQVAGVAPATPAPDVAAQAVPELAQQVQTQGVESAPTPPEGLTQAQQEQWFLEAETGTKYRTAEAAAAGIAEKDRFIERLLNERNQWQGQPQQQQPVVDPQAQVNYEIEALAQQIEQQYKSNPRFQGSDPDAIANQAYIDAQNRYYAKQEAIKELQRNTQEQQWKQTVLSTPELSTPLAAEVFDRFKATYGVAPADPQHHLDLVHAEMFRRGMQPMQRPQATTQGVQGAIQQQVQQASQLFPNVGGSGAPQVTAQMTETARKQIEFAMSRGITGEALERIKQRAITGEGISKR